MEEQPSIPICQFSPFHSSVPLQELQDLALTSSFLLVQFNRHTVASILRSH